MGNSAQETYRYVDANQLHMQELQLRVAALEREITLPDETLHSIIDIASYADSFDHIVISGGSREVTRTILTASGVAPEKIIGLSVFENGLIYKRSPFYQGIPDTERIAFTRNVLQQNSVAREHQASLCIVDDYINSGDKASAYLQTFSQLPNVDHVSFAVFSVAPYSHYKFYQPEGIVVPEHNDPYWNEHIIRLATIASVLHPENKQQEIPSPLRNHAHTILNKALTNIYTQINDERR